VSRLPSLPHKLGVAAPFAGVTPCANSPNGFLWPGGKKVWYDAAFVRTAPQGQWPAAGKLPRGSG
jgi:hypothetical protein